MNVAIQFTFLSSFLLKTYGGTIKLVKYLTLPVFGPLFVTFLSIFHLWLGKEGSKRPENIELLILVDTFSDFGMSENLGGGDSNSNS